MDYSEEHILRYIAEERLRQEQKFGPQPGHDLNFWLTTIMEELGEVANEAQMIYFGADRKNELREELVQVAALCVRVIGKLERGEFATR
jgi:NTP pyrophosphatase (non-canonical NTP hydrolase)